MAVIDKQCCNIILCGDCDVLADVAERTADELTARNVAAVGERTCDCALARILGAKCGRRVEFADHAADVVARARDATRIVY